MGLTRIKDEILNILFPPQCVRCEQKITREAQFSTVCNTCFSSIEYHTGYFCPICARRRYDLNTACHPRAGYVLAAATSYKNLAVQKLIHALKYSSVTHTAEPLAYILAHYCTSHSKLHDFLHHAYCIPIPLHARRERERGFNQATHIAETLYKKLDIPREKILTSALLRTRYTHAQAELRGEDIRRANIAGCFTVANPLLIQKQNIVLLDDVATSGATLSEAARVLKSAGARKIIALVVAKA